MTTSLYRFQAGGALRKDTYYLEREADQRLFRELLAGTYCNILSPRQMGKTSLAQRTALKLREQGRRVALVDLTRLGSMGVTAETWFCSLADAVGQDLGIDAMPFWDQHQHLTPANRLFRFLRAQVAAPESPALVVFIDEIDIAFMLPFADDFFAAVRAQYNAAPHDEASARLVFCLIGVSVPLDLTTDPRQTPFNIGSEIALADLARRECEPLAAGLTELGTTPDQLLDAVYGWTQGHPALTQFLCEKLVAQGPRGEDPVQRVLAIVNDTLLQPMPRDTRVLLHIENYFEQVGGQASRMLALYRQVLNGASVRVEHTNPVHIALRRLGLTAEITTGGACCMKPRNRLFTEVFNLDWVRRHEDTNQFTGAVQRWIDLGRQDRHLARSKAIPSFESWAKSRDELTTEERDFLLESKTLNERKISHQRGVFIGVAAFLAICLSFSIYQVVRLLSRPNEKVLALKRQLSEVRGDYESMVDYPVRRPLVENAAATIGESMLEINDERLNITHRIVKYQYASFAFMMVASCHALNDHAEQALYYAGRAIAAGERGLSLFDRVAQSKTKEDKQAYQWTLDDNGQNRMLYLLAMAQSIKGKALHEDKLKATALATLSRVESKYRKSSRPMRTHELAWICPPSSTPAVCEPEER